MDAFIALLAVLSPAWLSNGRPGLLNGRAGHAAVRHDRGCMRAAADDPLEGAKNALQSLRLKGMQRALQDAIAREDFAEAARLRDLIDANTPAPPAPPPAALPSDSFPSDSLSVLNDRIAEIKEFGGVTRVSAGCHCGAEPFYENCCGLIHAAGSTPTPLQTLLARYSAYCEASPEAVEYLIDTTHRNNSEWMFDRERWRAKVLDFTRSCGFDGLRILQTLNFRLTPQGLDLLDAAEAARGPALEGDRAYITWTARLRVLDGIVGDEYVEVKDFVERSIFVYEQGRWLYLGGDPDFQPKNIRVSGPLDGGGGGGGGGGLPPDFGRRVSNWLNSLASRR
jgi:uncharacterized protein YchJ